MSEQKDPDQEPTLQHDFAQVELVADMPAVGLRQEPKAGGSRSWMMALLFVGLLGALLLAVKFYLDLGEARRVQAELEGELAAFEASLQKTSGTLSAVSEQAAKLDETLNLTKKEAAELERRKQDLGLSLEQVNGELAATRKELEGLRRAQEEAKSELETRKREGERLEKKLAEAEKSRADQLASHQRQAEESRAAYEKQTADLNKRLDGSRLDLSKAREQESRLRVQLEEAQEKLATEAQAAQQVLREQSKLKGDLARIQGENKQLRGDLEKANGALQEAKSVKTGQLVVQQEGLRQGEPLSKGLWSGKSWRRGPIGVQVLVDENGRVEKAILLPGQALDGEMAQALTAWVSNWKFSPPTLQNIRVKAWQTLMVTPE